MSSIHLLGIAFSGVGGFLLAGAQHAERGTASSTLQTAAGVWAIALAAVILFQS